MTSEKYNEVAVKLRHLRTQIDYIEKSCRDARIDEIQREEWRAEKVKADSFTTVGIPTFLIKNMFNSIDKPDPTTKPQQPVVDSCYTESTLGWNSYKTTEFAAIDLGVASAIGEFIQKNVHGCVVTINSSVDAKSGNRVGVLTVKQRLL
jgi:hypothetical protein